MTIEREVLDALRAYTGPDEGGWHVYEDLPDPAGGIGLTHRLGVERIQAALGRLRRKGLVECCVWHPGQGGGAAREWLWFPVQPAQSDTPEPYTLHPPAT